MIQANELRIGNWVRIKESDTKIQVDADTIGFSHSVYYQTIPLTEEILFKCGFENRKTILGASVYFYGDFTFNELLILNWKQGTVNDIKYLHQLQNLVFSLTQTELNYKP